jgi:hypothetical protein
MASRNSQLVSLWENEDQTVYDYIPWETMIPLLKAESNFRRIFQREEEIFPGSGFWKEFKKECGMRC